MSGETTLVETSSLSIFEIPKIRAAESVRNQVLSLIEDGALPVGSKIPSEHDLAKAFNVSRPVVREGLSVLRATGVLESRTGAGTFVKATRPTYSHSLLLGRYRPEHLYEVRMQLEVPGAGLASERRTEEQLERLREIVARHKTRDQVNEWVDDDLDFHVLLGEATQNDLHASLVAELREVQLEQTVIMAKRTGLEAPREEHEAVLRAVENRDPEAAREAMATHLEAILTRFRQAEMHGDTDAAT